MNILFHLGHPAHFHLFKNTIRDLKEKGHTVLVVIKKKDILEDLLKLSGIDFLNILPQGRKDGKLHIAIGQLKQDFMLYKVSRKFKPDLLVGTSVAISHVGRVLGIPSLNVNEDDAAVVPLFCKLSYPFSTHILSPLVCNNGKWERKSIKYEGYHELAYLHPDHFVPSEEVVRSYFPADKPYFLIRFAKLTAHHDEGIKGISNELALRIVRLLEKQGSVYISSERSLTPELDKYRLAINPLDIHHVMAFASMYIGDSQTMAAEAGVLGTPFIRFNDFVGRIGYLEELENSYQMGFGIKATEPEKLIKTIKDLLLLPDRKKIWETRKNRLLAEKINVSAFFTWLIGNYPQSIDVLKKDPSYSSKPIKP